MVISLLLWPPRRRSNRTGSRTAPKPFLSDSQWVLLADLFPDGGQGGRTPACCLAPLSGGHFVGARERCALERFARAIPQSLYLLASTAGMGGRWTLPRSLASAARQTRPAETARLGRSDRRWLVCTSKKGGAEVGYGRKGKGSTIMLMVDGQGTPLSAFTTDASVSEVHAIETLVDVRTANGTPQRLMYDKAADADWLRDNLEVRGVELICPHRQNRTKPPRQDGRSLRRYQRRYKVERSISWLHNFRRLICRWEWYPELFEGFVHLACLYTILKRF